MTNETLVAQLKDLFAGCLNFKSLELIDLIYRVQGNRLMLTVLADKTAGNITLGECALLCRELKALLEEKNIIECDYFLEVASPGLDRPLKTKHDFQRCLNKEVVFFLNDLVNGKCQWQGLICNVDEAVVAIQAPGELLEIPLTKINKAKLII